MFSNYPNKNGSIFKFIFMNTVIGLRIRELRKQKKLTQKQFSSQINVDDSQLSKIEQGKLMPTLWQLLEISSIFETSLDWLTGRNNTETIKIGGDNKGIANTGVIAGDNNVTINKEAPSTENNTEDINSLLDSYNINKGVEIDRLQALYTTMLESKDAIIEEKNLLIQELKEQIQELREDKKHLKSLLEDKKL